MFIMDGEVTTVTGIGDDAAVRTGSVVNAKAETWIDHVSAFLLQGALDRWPRLTSLSGAGIGFAESV
jgi:hypothetical protein